MLLCFMVSIKCLFMFVCVALAVGFFTLLERKVLSYIQIRKGPNKVGFAGLPQPLSDAVKLFTKENLKVVSSNKPIFVFGPVLGVGVMFMLWVLYTSLFMDCIKWAVLFFFVISSVNVFSVLLSGWSSNSKYALLGSIRAVAQTISYEVSMALTIIILLFMSVSFNLKDIFFCQGSLWFVFVIPFVLIVWLISSLAETNRAPFDLAEGESELVSGFNIEYGSGEFAFLFISEYGSILLISLLTSLFFLGGMISFYLFGLLKFLLVSFFFLWVRGSFPRMRYDFLMSLTWKSFLSLIISYGCMVYCLNFYF